MSLDSLGLSMMKPSSVFSRAERGSKLNDPTKIFLSSIESVLACKLALALPKGPDPVGAPPSPHRQVRNAGSRRLRDGLLLLVLRLSWRLVSGRGRIS